MDESNPVVYRTVGTRDKTVGWYDKDFPGIEPEARELLEKYSHVPPDEVDKYVIGMVRYSQPRPDLTVGACARAANN